MMTRSKNKEKVPPRYEKPPKPATADLKKGTDVKKRKQNNLELW